METVNAALNADAGGTTASSTEAPSTGASASTTAAANDWTSSLPQPLKDYVGQKGFKDPGAVLDSYQNLEKLMGVPKERLLKLPDKADAPEWNEIYDRMGRPKEAKDYAFPKPPEGLKEDSDFKEWAQKNFHETGLTRKQGEVLAAKWNEFAQGLQQKQTEAYQANLKTEDASLKREWGAAYEQNIKAANKGAKTFGLDETKVGQLEKALGYSATLKFLSDLGSKLGEDSFVTGDTGQGFRGALTPDQARSKIKTLTEDREWASRYLNGGAAEKEEMKRLMEFAYPSPDKN